MGIDFLDMTFRLEKRFGIRMPPMTAWEPRYILGRRGLDLTAWDVAEVVAEQLAIEAARPRQVPGTVVLEYESASALARRDHSPAELAGDAAAVWPGVRDVLCDTLGRHPSDVTPDARLVSDLGMC